MLKEQAKAAANQVKARAGSAAGSCEEKVGKNLDEMRTKSKEKKVSRVVMVIRD